MSSLRDGTRYKHNVPPLAVYKAGEDMSSGAAICQSNRSKDMILQADADDESRMPCIGILLESKLLGQEALVVPNGLFMNPQRDSDFQPGDAIYVSTNRGKFTRVQPSVGTIQVVGEARNENSGMFYCIPPQIPVSYGYSELGNHTITPAQGTGEVAFATDFGVWHHGMLWAELDLSPLVADAPITVTGRLYHKIDETNLRQIDHQVSNVGTDKNHMTLSGAVTSGQTIKLSLQVSKAVGADRSIKHVFIQDT